MTTPNTSKQFGIVERLRAARSVDEVHALVREADGFEYMSAKTRRRVERISTAVANRLGLSSPKKNKPVKPVNKK